MLEDLKGDEQANDNLCPACKILEWQRQWRDGNQRDYVCGNEDVGDIVLGPSADLRARACARLTCTMLARPTFPSRLLRSP